MKPQSTMEVHQRSIPDNDLTITIYRFINSEAIFHARGIGTRQVIRSAVAVRSRCWTRTVIRLWSSVVKALALDSSREFDFNFENKLLRKDLVAFFQCPAISYKWKFFGTFSAAYSTLLHPSDGISSQMTYHLLHSSRTDSITGSYPRGYSLNLSRFRHISTISGHILNVFIHCHAVLTSNPVQRRHRFSAL
jgi:hypothetical protein